MKSKKLTAEEISIGLSEADINSIPFQRPETLPANAAALTAIYTGLKLRGKGMNMFVCGPSAAERFEITVKIAAETAAKTAPPSDIIVYKRQDNYSDPSLLRLSAGNAGNLKTDLSLLERIPFIEKWSPVIGDEISEILAEIGDNNIAVLTTSCSKTAPLITEDNPIPRRLFGKNSSSPAGVRAGSLVKSGGGILLLNAEDLLTEEESWHRLKRALRTGKSEIGTANNEKGIAELLFLPEIIQDYKVVILGSEQHYDHFYNNDEDFRELFQFFAEFDSDIELTQENLALEVNHFRAHALDNHKMKLSDNGALEAIKYSIGATENICRLSTSLSEVDLIISEAAAASDPEEQIIYGPDVLNAVNRQSERYALLEKRIFDDIESGTIELRVDGSEIGKVNGLAVIDKGPYSFGFPGLISARTAPGENGLVNIEHEAGLSGEIHDKWVLILEGFLRSRFALDFPISIFASICFEQSYSEIDGDSASSSELYALLSAISGIPVRQDIAVTGSLSQTGEIQAVGGLREKIEGFYKTCRTLNYTGTQGVIVPEKNIKNIILPDEIIEEIRSDRFHVYPVSTVNDSMEILTGIEAGSRNSRGVFPHGTLNHQIEKNLKKLAQQAKSSGG